MRKRMIDPSFWDDAEVGSLSISARLLFIGLISHADDEGRGVADTRSIRKTMFGFDMDVTVDNVQAWLDEIAVKVRNVQFYQSDNRQYYCLMNWSRYQKISHPSPSSLPGPHGTDGGKSVGGEGRIKSNIFKAYEENISPLTGSMSEILKLAEQDYPEKYILDSFTEAVKHNKRNWAYCESIIKRWMIEGQGGDKPTKESRAIEKSKSDRNIIARTLKVQ